MEEETITKYQRRLDEVYDLEDDKLYTTWAKLKKKAETTHSKSRPQLSDCTNTSSQVQPSSTCSDITTILEIPQIPELKKSTTRGTYHLPKHLSSYKMIKLLEDKRNEKIKEAEEMERRKYETRLVVFPRTLLLPEVF